MLIEELYTMDVRTNAEGLVEAGIRVNGRCPVYQGHFPGFPITPGVLQVQIIKEVLEGALGQDLRLSDARSVKFTSMHEPDRAAEIAARIRYERVGERIRADAVLYYGETVYMKLKGEFISQA
jgi:3-hydroxyacyl-[acyl-carrier-protein] dehydratase